MYPPDEPPTAADDGEPALAGTALRRRALQIAGVYLVVATLWIVASEWVANALLSDAASLSTASVVKGIGFVVVTAGLLLLLLRRVFARITDGVAAIGRQEETVARLGRLHRARGDMSRAVVGTSSRDELLAACCRSLVEVGGFAIAWVGLADQSTARLAPVASWGDEQGHLDDVVVRTDDSQTGRGPSGTAYREDRPYICNDLAADPATAPWWGVASTLGVRASAAFPIHSGGRAIGTLSVYSTRPHVFQVEEVDLLVAAAAEVSAALDRLDHEAMRRAAEERAEAERRFSEAMITTGPGIMFLYDTSGRFLRWNPNIEMITGYTADEIAQMTAVDFVPDHDRERVVTAIATAVAEGQAEVETDLVTKDGTAIPYWLMARATDFDGRTCLVSTGVDISERTRAEQALRASEAETRSLIEAIPHMVWITRPDGYHTDFNQRWLDYTGRTLEDSLGHGWNSAFHPDDRARADRLWHTATSTGHPYEIEYRLRRADGTYHWMLGRALPLRDESGTIVKWVGTCTDIDDLKAAEERIAEQAALLDLAQDAIVVLDLDRRVRYWNRGAEGLFGWTADEAVGRSAGDLHHFDPHGYAEAIAILLEHGEWSGDLRYVARSGAEVLAEGRWTLLRDDAGVPRSVLAVDTDVTERRRIERQFLRAQRFESIGTLASGIAHDLNNLLAPIVMGVGLLRGNEDERTKLVVDAMEASAQRGSDLVKQVMSFAKGIDGDRSEVDITDVIDEIIAITATTFPKDLDVDRDAPDDLWPVIADRTQIHQVLLNLCVNARDAMPTGGRMTIRARNEHIDEQYAQMDQRASSGDHVVLEVADEGVGMGTDLLDRIFEPFFTTKQPDRGTGLGLSTVMNIVRSHGGFIDVRSQVGHGTTFTVHLPAAHVGAAPRPASHTPHDVEKASPRGVGDLVLVVDDEPVILDITTRTLERSATAC